MQFDISADTHPSRKRKDLNAARARLEAKLSKTKPKGEQRHMSTSKVVPAAESGISASRASIVDSSSDDEGVTAPASAPPSPPQTRYFNPNSTINPAKAKGGQSPTRPCVPRDTSSSVSTALVVIPPNREERVANKPQVPNRKEGADNHMLLKDRDFQSQHEEITHLRSNLPDLEKTINVLKTENVRLRTELLVKGKDCDHFKELANQMKIARDREVSSLAKSREEWGKVVSDRDASVDRLQKDLQEARQRINELLTTDARLKVEMERLKREFAEEKAMDDDVIRQLRHSQTQMERDSGVRQAAHQDALANHSELTDRLRNEVHLLSVENNALRLKVVDWDSMVSEIHDLQAQIGDYKRNRNSTETRLRQELGEAAEEIHLLREEKAGLLRLVEKMELQANAAMTKLEAASGRNSPGRAALSSSLSFDTRPMSPEEEITALTATRTRITKELQSFRDGEWSNTLGSIGKLRQHLTEEEVKRREAEDRMEQERGARRRIEREVVEKLKNTEATNAELRLMVSTRDKDIDELHRRQLESARHYAQLKADAAKDKEELHASQKEVAALKATVHELKEKNLTSSKENARLFEQITSQAEIILRQQNDIDAFESERMHSRNDFLRVETEKKKLQEDYEVVSREQTSCCEELRLAKRAISELNAKIGQMGKQGKGSFEDDTDDEDAFTDVEEAYDENGSLIPESELSAYCGRVTTRIVRTKRGDIDNNIHCQEVKAMTKKALRTGLVETKKKLDSSKRLVDELSSQLAASSEKLSHAHQLEEKIASLTPEIVRLTTEKVKAERAEATLKTKVFDLERALTDEHQLLEKERQKNKETNAKLVEREENHVRVLADSKAQSEASLRACEEVISTLGQELASVKESHRLLNEKHKILEESNAQTENFLRENQAENALLRQQLDSSALQVNALTNTVSELSGQVALLGSSNKSNENEISELRKKLDEERSKRQDLEGKCVSLSGDLESLQSQFNTASLDHSKEREIILRQVAEHESELIEVKNLKASNESSLRKEISELSAALEEARKDRSAERKQFAEQYDFDKKALMARQKQTDGKRKDLENALEQRTTQLRLETQKVSDLSDQLKTEVNSLKHKSQCDLEQMRESYERALAKLRSQVDGAEIIEELRKKLAKAEKELRDIKQVQLHW